MSPSFSRASTVIIGAGIVGNSLAYHLVRLGWRDVVLVDKGPMPNPGGSTGHASNFIFPIEYSRMMMDLTRDSVEQYRELNVFTQSGGIEVARTAERRVEQLRRASQAKAWGVPAEVLGPAEVGQLVPYLDPEVILGGLYFPTAGVVDSLRGGTIMRERAEELSGLTIHAGAEVLGIDVSRSGRVERVRTTVGDFVTNVCVICCGVWSRRVAQLAGARLPLTPVVHQMVRVGPIPLFVDTVGEIAYPIVRDVDKSMYERQHGENMEVGSYAHRPIIIDPDDIPSNEDAVLSPTEMPFTNADFDPQLADARQLMPELLGHRRVGIRYAINGLISMTPDGHPLLGETPEVKGLWSAAASWIKEGPAVGRAVAEWMTGGVPEIDVHQADVARFYDFQRTRQHVVARAREGFNKMYGIVHPSEQWEREREIRLSPMVEQQRRLGGVMFQTAGWERPHWYATNEVLLDRFGAACLGRETEWDTRWWSPIINAEHLAMRESCGIVDLSAFALLDIVGPRALEAVEALIVAQADVAIGRVVYTSLLGERGGLKADLTVMRLGANHFRFVTGGAVGMADKKWIRDHLPDDGSAQLVDLTSAWSTIGLWGPKARDVLECITPDDVSNASFRFGTCRALEVNGISVLASRISYVGELGWELHVPMEQAARLWDTVWDAGQPHALVPVGIGVYGTTGRLEKSYRAYGNDLMPDYNLVEAGLSRPSVKKEEFIGKRAYLAQRERSPAAMLCTLTVEEHRGTHGRRSYPLGGEPILTTAGEPLVDGRRRRSYVTSAGSGPSVGKHLLLSYLPAELAMEGEAYIVECMGEAVAIRVAVVGSTPLYDPANQRIRA